MRAQNKILSEKQWKVIKHWHHQKFLLFFVCMYKLVDIRAETWNKAGVSVIRIYENDNVNKTVLLLLCISDISKRCGSRSIYDLIGKEVKREIWS